MSEEHFDFRSKIDETDWYPLEIHHTNGALFIVSEDLELEVVAQAVSQDDVSTVKAWLESGKLTRPSAEQVEVWRQDPYAKLGRFIIVAPYVFLSLA